MSAAANVSAKAQTKDQVAFILKWVASLIQILGYAATAFEVTPWNVYLFLLGVLGWFAVGLLWNDRAIMLIHVVAFAALIAGLLSS
ncbi:MAG: ubiquinone biosynthesis methyltransferase UbiE [Litoreibacter sp.]|nr:ubiquinone biosynthesis methyltransferase UbiE [Litoreibacter sp.]